MIFKGLFKIKRETNYLIESVITNCSNILDFSGNFNNIRRNVFHKYTKTVLTYKSN